MKEDLQRIDALLEVVGLQKDKYLRQALEILLEDKAKSWGNGKGKEITGKAAREKNSFAAFLLAIFLYTAQNSL